MANGLSGIQPRSLNTEELLKYYAMWLDSGEPVPVNWQAELLRRVLKMEEKIHELEALVNSR